MKLGMKQFAGITRVTMRKRDGYIFVINEPEVLKSADGGNSFVCFSWLTELSCLLLERVRLVQTSTTDIVPACHLTDLFSFGRLLIVLAALV